MTRVQTPQGVFNYRRGHVDSRRIAESGDAEGSVGSNRATEGSDAVQPHETSISELVGSCGDPVPYDQFMRTVNQVYIFGYEDGWKAAIAAVQKRAEDTGGK